MMEIETTANNKKPAPLRVVPSLPIAPTTLEESGLSLDMTIQLSLKTLHFAGELTGGEHIGG